MKSGLTEKWIVCRICLTQPTTEVMQTIFDKSDEKDLTQMILECGGVPIKKYDHYPDKICSKCLKYLHVAYKFRVTCQRSHKHLSRFIAPVVVEENNAHANTVVSQNETEPEPELSFDYADDPEDITSKLEVGIKQELEENIDEDVMDIYEPLNDGVDEIDDEFEPIDECAGSNISDDIEYLEEIVAADNTSDEEFVPNAKNKTKKSPKSKASKQAKQKPTKSRFTVMFDADKTPAVQVVPKKRGPKPRRFKQSAYICDMCGNQYPSQGRLTEHIKLHKGIKPHECEICGHAFAQTQQLARHMNTHTGNRPFKCNYCTAAFADLSTRNKHHRIHTNERPYVCDVCGKTFTYTNTLKFHKMIHTGEKPHVCDYCGKGFQQAYKLRNHKKIHDKIGSAMRKIKVETVETLPNYQEDNVATAQILDI